MFHLFAILISYNLFWITPHVFWIQVVMIVLNWVLTSEGNILSYHGKAEIRNHNQNLRKIRSVDQLAWFSSHSKSVSRCDRWICFFQVISEVGASLLRDNRPRSEMTLSVTPLLLELNLLVWKQHEAWWWCLDEVHLGYQINFVLIPYLDKLCYFLFLLCDIKCYLYRIKLMLLISIGRKIFSCP